MFFSWNIIVFLIVCISLSVCSKIPVGFVGPVESYSMLVGHDLLSRFIAFSWINISAQDIVTLEYFNEIVPKLTSLEMIVSYNWSPYLDIWSQIPPPKLRTMLLGNVGISIIKTWSDRSNWYKWMQYSGFGQYTVRTLPRDTKEFPCLFRSPGVGLHVVHSRAAVDSLVSSLSVKNYFLEEALYGMGAKQGRYCALKSLFSAHCILL